MTFIPNEADAGIDGEQAELDSVDLDVILDGFRLRGVKSGCAVTAGSNLDTVVAAGSILYDGATVAIAGGTLSHAAAGSQLRFDLVVADSSGTLSIIDGTAFYSATYGPSLPTYSNKVVLAVVTIPANATSLSSSNIVDHRITLSDQWVLKETFTAGGDMLYATAAATPVRLPIGTANYIMRTDGNIPVWSSPATIAALIDHGLLAGLSDDDHAQYVLRSILTTNGDMFIRAAGVIDRLAVGGANTILGVSGGLPAWQAQSYIDHGSLSGLSDDDHAIYLLLAGRAGGQTARGGTAASEVLTFESTSHGTKGSISILDQIIIANNALTADDQFVLGTVSATEPKLQFATNDTLSYDRTADQFTFTIGGQVSLTLTADVLTTGVDGTGIQLVLAAIDGTNEGGEMLFNGAGSNTDWTVDNNSGELRFFPVGASSPIMKLGESNASDEILEVVGERNDTAATGAKQFFAFAPVVSGTGGDFRIFVVEPVVTAAGLSAAGLAVFRGGTRWRNSGGLPGSLYGMLFASLILDANSVNFGTIDEVVGARYQAVSRVTANPTGTVTGGVALQIVDSTAGAYTLTAQVGLDIAALTKGATNIGIRNASNQRQTGYLSLHGATVAPAATTDGYFFAPFYVIGQNQAPLSGTAFLAQPEDLAPSAVDGVGAQFYYERSAGAGGLGGLTSFASEVFDSTSSGTQSGEMVGVLAKATKLGASTSTFLRALKAMGRIDAGTITSLNVLDVFGNTYSGGAVTTARGLNIANLGNAIVGTAVGIDIDAQSGASANFGIRNASNLVQAGYARFGAVTAPTDTASGVVYVDEKLYVGNNDLTDDEQFFLSAISSGAPGITFATDDYLAYDRADDAFVFAIGATEIMQVEDFGIEFQGTQRIDFVANTSGTAVFRVFQSGDTQPRFQIRGEAGAAGAAIYWGAGGATALDVAMYRSAADVLRLDDSFTIAGYLRVGSNTAPTNNTAGDLTLVRLTVGSDAAFSNSAGLFAKFVGTFTNTASGAVAGFNFGPTISPATDSSSEFRILNMSALVSTSDVAVGTVTTFQSEIDYRALNPGATGDVTGLVQTVNVTPVVLRSINDARQAITTARGIYINPYSRPSGSGTVSITNMYGLLVDGPTSAGATVTNHWAISLVNPGANYAPTTMYGIDIEKFTRATNNIEFRNAGKMVYTPTAQTLGAATDTIVNTARIIELSNSTGASLTLTSDPTISTTGAQDGQIITLVNDDSADNIVLRDDSVASSALRLPGAANLTLGPRDSATFYFNAGAGEWYCIASTNL